VLGGVPMKPCPNCGLEDFCHQWQRCELWPGTDGEWHRSLTPDSHIREPQIGLWWTFCCEQDLAQIETQEEIQGILLDRKLWYNSRVWPTKEEALEELLEDRAEGTSEVCK